jgi:lysophospholipase L1-like esterase
VPSIRSEKRPGAKPLLAYVEIIQETAEQFGIPVLDLYHTLPIDPHDPTHYEAYTTDGLHFNDAGHAILAQRLKTFIEAL